MFMFISFRDSRTTAEKANGRAEQWVTSSNWQERLRKLDLYWEFAKTQWRTSTVANLVLTFQIQTGFCLSFESLEMIWPSRDNLTGFISMMTLFLGKPSSTISSLTCSNAVMISILALECLERISLAAWRPFFRPGSLKSAITRSGL